MLAESETFRLLQPGLMSIEELKELISQRGVFLKSNENESKDKLVELYERLLLPMSQRKFPNSHQGQIINKKIVEEDKERARNEPKSRNDFQYGFKDKSSGSSLKRHSNLISSSSSRGDRLKPPLDSSSLSPKMICLSKRSSTDKDLDKIVINDCSKRNSESSCDRSGRQISRKQEKRDADKKSPAKSHSSTHKEPKEKDKEEPNPKRKRIAWP